MAESILIIIMALLVLKLHRARNGARQKVKRLEERCEKVSDQLLVQEGVLNSTEDWDRLEDDTDTSVEISGQRESYESIESITGERVIRFKVRST